MAASSLVEEFDGIVPGAVFSSAFIGSDGDGIFSWSKWEQTFDRLDLVRNGKTSKAVLYDASRFECHGDDLSALAAIEWAFVILDTDREHGVSHLESHGDGSFIRAESECAFDVLDSDSDGIMYKSECIFSRTFFEGRYIST